MVYNNYSLLEKIGPITLIFPLHRFSISKFIYVLKFICNPQVNPAALACYSRTCTEGQNTRFPPHAPSWSPTGRPPLISALIAQTCVFFKVYWVPCLSHFVLFLVILLLKCLPSSVLKCSLSIPKGKKVVMGLTNRYWISFPQSWVIMLLAMSSGLKNEPYVWNTYKTRLYIDHWWKC